jgi:virginiamycin B lyase
MRSQKYVGIPTYQRSSALRQFVLVFALMVGLSKVLGAMLSAAQAAPLGGLKQFRIPTPDSDPKHITLGSDGNLWFTESFVESQNIGHNIGRITPAGEITEFQVCTFCFPNDIVQGPDGDFYFTQSHPSLERIAVDGQVQANVPTPSSNVIGNAIVTDGSENLWFTDFNNNSIWRYNVFTGEFTEFPVPTPAANPYDVAVDANGIVWFTEFHARQIGRLDPQTRVITETPVGGDPRHIAIASDGTVWFTERFSNAIGRLDPSTNQVTEFQLSPRRWT